MPGTTVGISDSAALRGAIVVGTNGPVATSELALSSGPEFDSS
jgi:hypothetical protein